MKVNLTISDIDTSEPLSFMEQKVIQHIFEGLGLLLAVSPIKAGYKSPDGILTVTEDSIQVEVRS